jgi:hypothetical protein
MPLLPRDMRLNVRVMENISLLFAQFRCYMTDCGNMLIIAYAHAAKSGDGSLISKYVSRPRFIATPI